MKKIFISTFAIFTALILMSPVLIFFILGLNGDFNIVLANENEMDPASYLPDDTKIIVDGETTIYNKTQITDDKIQLEKYAYKDIACKEYDYPWCKDKPEDIGDLVGKFYNYALAAVGVAALGAIIFGGVKYTVSAGNPSGQADAIQWITGAVWGLILLLGANLLLRTINPKLTSLEMIKLEPVEVERASKAFNTTSPQMLNFYSGNISSTALKEASKYKSSITEACAGSSIPNCSDVITTLIAAESGGNPIAKSDAGALGLMQLLESNGGKQCLSGDTSCIQDQINKGVNFLSKTYKGDISLTLAEYNGGEAAVKQSACCSTGYAYQCDYDCGTTQSHTYSCDKDNTNPACKPNTGFVQTRNYVNKICGVLGNCQ